MTLTFLIFLIFMLADVSFSATINGDQSEKKPPWEKMLPRSRRNADPCTSVICRWSKTGLLVKVPIEISPSYTAEERDKIVTALLSFHESTCVRFVLRRPLHRDYLYFFSGDRCYSYLGRQRGKQEISLNNSFCLDMSTVQHEVIHALGFHHEQSRSDRDEHVTIVYDNIQPEARQNFEKVQTDNLGTPYDFDSVMHYRNDEFSRNNNSTIVARSNPNLQFGNALQMNENDITRVNRLFGCYQLAKDTKKRTDS